MLPAAYRPPLRRAATWLGLAVIAQTLVLGIAAAIGIGGEAARPEMVAYVVIAAVGMAIAVAIPLAMLHVIVRALEWRRKRVWMAVLALWPSWQQARFLTSGDAVSRLSWVGALRVGLLGGMAGGLALLWVWH